MPTPTIALSAEPMLRLKERANEAGIAPVDEQEQVILKLAAGEMARDEFTAWLSMHMCQHLKASEARTVRASLFVLAGRLERWGKA